MLFQSASFGIFLVLVLGAYWWIANRRRLRYWLLLVASYWFYGSYEFWYLGLIVFSTFLDYWCGARMHASEDPKARRSYLLISLAGNLGLLCFFKYTDWALDSLSALLASLGIETSLHETKAALLPQALFVGDTTSILVPVGISFYTFQTLSYTIDIYRRRLEPARNLQEFALFVAYFPQLVAGPIVRAIDFLPQLEHRPRLSRADLHEGLYRLGMGLAKKVVLADVLGRYLVDPVYTDPSQYTPVAHLLCLYAFTFQIYFDFAGYSDCAIGAARLFGFRLPENFDAPYRSLSIREFWRRWHITLSSWVRDYIFIPLGGSRGSEVVVVRNLVITMVTIGLWHGASILWVYYGLLQAVVMILERWLERARGGRPFATTPARRFLAWVLTFHFIVLSCLFIRARSMENLTDMLSDFGALGNLSTWGLLALAASFLTHFQPRALYAAFERRVKELPTPVAGALIGVVAGCVAILVVGDTPFIYFQF